jgi:hypothetical protein
MRKIIVLILFFVSFSSFGQDEKIINFQKERFDYAILFLEQSEFEKAADLFSYVHKLIPNNELGKFALKKVDSLKPIIRKKFKEKVSGKWKMTKDNLNITNVLVKYIEIENDQISYYEQLKNSKEVKLVKKERMKFVDQIGMNRSFTEFADSNKKIWALLIDESTGILRVINTGEETKDGRTESVCGNIEYEYIKVQ